MQTYLVSYDLKFHETSESYRELINSIKSFDHWAKPLESTWLIKSNLTAMQVTTFLMEKIDANDKILVMNVNNNWACFWLSDEIVKWMQNGL